METADRNRKIKQVLTQAFGKGKVTVRGHRGTAYGWVTVDIAYAPKDVEERRELEAKVWELFRASNIEIGSYDSADYGSGNNMHLNFEQCRDVFNAGERVYWNGRAGTVKDRDYRRGGDWYSVQWDDAEKADHSGKIEFYKGDLTREAPEATNPLDNFNYVGSRHHY